MDAAIEPITSETLAQKAQRGDQAALNALIARHKDDAYRVALRMSRRPVDAEEILQISLERVVRHLSRYDPSRAFKPWLLSIVVNQTRSYMRLRRVRYFFTGAPPEPTWSPEGQCGAERGAHRRSVRRLLERAVASLPEGQREVFVLKHIEGLSYDEIAVITGDSAGSLKVRNHRARRAILNFFCEHGVTLAALCE